MNIQKQLTKAFETTKLITTQALNSRRITEGSAININYNGTSTTTLGMNTIGNYATGTDSTASTGTLQFKQPSFGSGAFINNKPSIPFENLELLNQAKIIKDFLISRGVNKINEETAKALFITNLYIGTEKEKIVKQPKKKLKF